MKARILQLRVVGGCQELPSSSQLVLRLPETADSPNPDYYPTKYATLEKNNKENKTNLQLISSLDGVMSIANRNFFQPDSSRNFRLDFRRVFSSRPL